MAYKARRLTSPAARSRRKRTENEAVKLLDGLGLSPARRRHAIGRIRNARCPRIEAQRIVDQAARADVAELGGDDIGLADVQELRAKLARRDGGVWSPQALMLRRMDCMIVSSGITRQEFDGLAAAVWGLKQTLPGAVRETA